MSTLHQLQSFFISTDHHSSIYPSIIDVLPTRPPNLFLSSSYASYLLVMTKLSRLTTTMSPRFVIIVHPKCLPSTFIISPPYFSATWHSLPSINFSASHHHFSRATAPITCGNILSYLRPYHSPKCTTTFHFQWAIASCAVLTLPPPTRLADIL